MRRKIFLIYVFMAIMVILFTFGCASLSEISNTITEMAGGCPSKKRIGNTGLCLSSPDGKAFWLSFYEREPYFWLPFKFAAVHDFAAHLGLKKGDVLYWDIEKPAKRKIKKYEWRDCEYKTICEIIKTEPENIPVGMQVEVRYIDEDKLEFLFYFGIDPGNFKRNRLQNKSDTEKINTATRLLKSLDILDNKKYFKEKDMNYIGISLYEIEKKEIFEKKYKIQVKKIKGYGYYNGYETVCYPYSLTGGTKCERRKKYVTGKHKPIIITMERSVSVARIILRLKDSAKQYLAKYFRNTPICCESYLTDEDLLDKDDILLKKRFFRKFLAAVAYAKHLKLKKEEELMLIDHKKNIDIEPIAHQKDKIVFAVVKRDCRRCWDHQYSCGGAANERICRFGGNFGKVKRYLCMMQEILSFAKKKKYIRSFAIYTTMYYSKSDCYLLQRACNETFKDMKKSQEHLYSIVRSRFPKILQQKNIQKEDIVFMFAVTL